MSHYDYDANEGYRGDFQGYWFDGQGRLDSMPEDAPINKSLTKLRAKMIYQLKKNNVGSGEIVEYRLKYNPGPKNKWDRNSGKPKGKVIGKIFLSQGRYEHHTYRDYAKNKLYVLNTDGSLGRVIAPGTYATKR